MMALKRNLLLNLFTIYVIKINSQLAKYITILEICENLNEITIQAIASNDK